MFIVHRSSFIVLFSVLALSAAGGSLDSPAPPTYSASAMYTLQDLYNRLAAGAAGAPRVGAFREPSAGPTAGVMRTLDELMAKAPAAQTNAAEDADVLFGKAYWSLNAGVWGLRTGTMEIHYLADPSNKLVEAGYYAGTNLSQVDPDLTTGNIRAGVVIFGVTGKPAVVDTSSGDAAAGDILAGRKAWVDGAEVVGSVPAGASVTGAMGALAVAIPDGMYTGSKTATAADTNLAAAKIATNVTIFGIAGTLNTNYIHRLSRTGQTVSYAVGDDGFWEKGLASPAPRFTVQGDTNAVEDPLTNCVLDNLTGLMWARSCTGTVGNAAWSNALGLCDSLTNGGYDDWRLPNIGEMQSLLDYGAAAPPLPAGHPFLDLPAGGYWWTSTTKLYLGTTWAYDINVASGQTSHELKTSVNSAWPVRGGR